MKPVTDDDLLNYLDQELDAETRQRIEHLLKEDTGIAQRMKELKIIHGFLLSRGKLDLPSRNFTDKVMSRLHEKPALAFFSPRNGLLLLGGILVASGLTLMLLSKGTFDQLPTILNLEALPLKTDLVKIPSSLPFDMKLTLKIFLGLNLVIGFILLDRTILRPIFQRRHERYA
jgi:hypothetical protein